MKGDKEERIRQLEERVELLSEVVGLKDHPTVGYRQFRRNIEQAEHNYSNLSAAHDRLVEEYNKAIPDLQEVVRVLRKLVDDHEARLAHLENSSNSSCIEELMLITGMTTIPALVEHVQALVDQVKELER